MDGDVFYLYRWKEGNLPDSENSDIQVYKSSLFSKPFSERVSGKTTAEYNDFYTELRWRVASRNKLKIYYIADGNTIVHSSFCTPKSFKFPFMAKGDFHIGPCFTDERYRGKGIYSEVLRYIVSDLRSAGEMGKVYVIISSDNTSSRNGVLKAGFEEVAVLYRRGWLRKYYVKQWL